MGSKKLTKGLFFVYFLALIWIILFKMQFSLEELIRSRSMNLIPFAESFFEDGRMNTKEIADNVLIFIPYGVFVCMLGRGRSFWKKAAPVLVTSFVLEVLQFILAAGACDITDLITNTAGGLIGMGIFGLFHKICGEKTDAAVNAVMLCAAVFLVLFVGILTAANW